MCSHRNSRSARCHRGLGHWETLCSISSLIKTKHGITESNSIQTFIFIYNDHRMEPVLFWSHLFIVIYIVECECCSAFLSVLLALSFPVCVCVCGAGVIYCCSTLIKRVFIAVRSHLPLALSLPNTHTHTHAQLVTKVNREFCACGLLLMLLSVRLSAGLISRQSAPCELGK